MVSCLGLQHVLDIQLVDSLGRPVTGAPVTWTLTSGHGTLNVPSQGTTDATGYSTGRYTLASIVETASIRITAVGATDSVIIVVTGASPCPVRIQSGSFPTVGQTGAVLPNPLVVNIANDSGSAPGHQVNWTVVSGGGSVNPAASTSDANGNARTTFTLGPIGGTQAVRADLVGTTSSLTLTATALDPNAAPQLVATIPGPPNATYVHDSFVRDGLAFVCDWNEGVWIYDVGNGMLGGTPNNPKLISSLITSANGVAAGPSVHNAWWFHNSVTNENRYLFIGQEGPAVIGSSSSGDIHIVDVSNLAAPVEVGFIHIPGAGTHNFWMDESQQILYAAYYNGGVIKVDVSGTLSGDMSNRIITEVKPGGAGDTFVWGVMLANGTLYASDMVSGFWALDPESLDTKGGGNNVPGQLTSDLWVSGQFGYTGTWGGESSGNVKIWALDGNGVPTLANTLVIPNITTVSDVAVTDDGKMLVITAEGGPGEGLYVYDRVDPAHPALRGYVAESGSNGFHTGEVATINGRTYVFVAVDPNHQALKIFDITATVP